VRGAALAGRFESKVDRSGEHHLWTGSKKADGTGKLKIEGRTITAPRVAWELAHGPLPPGVVVVGCEVKACVRVEHLSLRGDAVGADGSRRPRRRAPRGSGTKVEVRPGVWKLTVTAGRYDDGSVRREHRTVRAKSLAEVDRELAEFAAEIRIAPQPTDRTRRDVTIDEAIEQFMTEYLLGEKGREPGTVEEYRGVHVKWFSPEIGHRRVRDIDEATIDRLFGRMRKAGLSRSRMQAARNLYGPFFRWAKRRRIVRHNPMAEFELPTSLHVPREHLPPEVEQLSAYLRAAMEVVPEVAPVLTLGAVTGMRRGELVAIRRSRVFPDEGRIRIDTAVDGLRVKTTKTRKVRDVAVDTETVAMLARHCAEMDERAAACGTRVGAHGFVFSLEPDCSLPMPADLVTRRVSILKDHLGIASKRQDTIELEEEALRLFRLPPEPRPKGRRGPAPAGGLSYKEIGRRLGRTGRWAQLAVASAQRREAALANGPIDVFDGSIVALRKFTSSELLDAGFNISMVAERQGHGPQVLVKHYARSRPSADRKAAEHLGQVVHGSTARSS
jgi:integrase